MRRKDIVVIYTWESLVFIHPVVNWTNKLAMNGYWVDLGP